MRTKTNREQELVSRLRYYKNALEVEREHTARLEQEIKALRAELKGANK